MVKAFFSTQGLFSEKLCTAPLGTCILIEDPATLLFDVAPSNNAYRPVETDLASKGILPDVKVNILLQTNLMEEL